MVAHEPEGVSAVFAELCELAIRSGGKAICQLAGCWEVDFAGDRGGRWFAALNGHGKPVACSRGAEVPSYTWYLEWNGWPAGLVNAAGGMMAAGSEANEERLLAAVRAVLADPSFPGAIG